MSDAIKLGPLFNRAVFDPKRKVVKYRGRTLARFEEVKQLRVREYITLFEEEQLLNLHPEVEKRPRTAELYVDLRDGKSHLVATLDQGGLLLAQASEAAAQMNVPIATERARIGAEGGPPVPPH